MDAEQLRMKHYNEQTADSRQVSQPNANTNISGWVSVNDSLPEHLETVWISNGKGWTTLGCRSDLYDNNGDGCYSWCWAAATYGKHSKETNAEDFSFSPVAENRLLYAVNLRL